MILLEEKEQDWSNSINAYLLAEGHVAFSDNGNLPDEVKDWLEFEEEARESGIGVW